MPDELETKVLWIESLIPRLRSRIDAATFSLQATDQEIAELLYRGDQGPPPPPPPNSIVRGSVFGGNSNGISGQPITITDSLGNVLGTGTSASLGAYSIAIYLAASASVTVTVVPTSARQTTTAVTATATSGGTTIISVTLNPATGYAYGPTCTLPILQTLTLTSLGACGSITFPNDTLTYQARPAWLIPFGAGPFLWLGTANITAGLGVFAATDYHYIMSPGGGFSIGSQSVPHLISLGTAPIPSTCVPFSWVWVCGTQNFGGTIAE